MPPRGPEFAGQQAQQGGFARSVGAQQGAVASLLHPPVDVVQNRFLTGIAGQKQADVVQRDQRRGRGHGGVGRGHLAAFLYRGRLVLRPLSKNTYSLKPKALA